MVSNAGPRINQHTGLTTRQFLINLALIVTVSLGYGLQRLFYGPLRAIETEQLYDKAWFAVSETLLAMTIFRDDIGVWFFAMFLCLLGGKVWQWIGEGRVEFLEQQPPANPRLFHTRLMSSLLLSVAFDIFMMNYCIDRILGETRPGVMVMFGFEYVLLAIASISTLSRYALSLVELVIVQRQETARSEARRIAREQAQQRASTADGSAETAPVEEDDDEGDVPGWEEKGRWVFYLDLTTGVHLISRSCLTEANMCVRRFCQVCCVSWLLHDPHGLLRHSYSYHERPFYDCSLIHQEGPRFRSIQKRHSRYERSLPGRYSRGVGS
jgi:E3 ubiquitin-protein ligase synoviolin